MKTQLHKMVLLATALILVGCGPRISGDGTLAVTALNLPVSADEGWTAQIVCSRGKHEITQEIVVAGTVLTAEFTIPIGKWDVSLQLIDSSGQITYQDKVTGVVVYPDTPTSVNFQLKPAHGKVKVIINLDSHPYADYIMRARIHFNDQYKEVIRESLEESLEGEYELAPGSYDFNVELYTESFRVGDKFDRGVWDTIKIEPLTEQTIIWNPYLTKLTITAEIYVLPEAPPKLTADYFSNQVFLQWEPSPAADLDGYYIYWQPSPFEPYSVIGSVNSHTRTFIHDLNDLDSIPPRANYAVAPYSTVLVGYRSKPITVELLELQ